MQIRHHRVALTTAGLALAVGAGAAVAWGSGATSSAAGDQSPAAATATVSTTPAPGRTGPRPARARSLLSRADHATVEVKAHGHWVTYDLDRGKVTAVSPTSITLSRPDGQSVTEQITSSTRYAGIAGESSVSVGRPAVVISLNGTAVRIHQRPAAGTSSSFSNASAIS